MKKILLVSVALQDVLNTAMLRREGIVKPDYRTLESLANSRLQIGMEWVERYGADYLMQIAIQAMTPVERTGARISSEEAINDARVLHMLLRMNYGAYMFYGGDEVFVPLFDRIAEALSVVDVWDTGPNSDYVALLHEYLSSVIADNHFAICSRVLGAPENIAAGYTHLGTTADFFVGEDVFDRSENGFRCRASGIYVTGVVGHKIDDVFRLTLNSEGEFAYMPVIVVPGRSSLQSYPLTLLYEGGTNEMVAVLQRYESSRRDAQAYPSLTRIDGFPVVSISFMSFYPNMESARQFFSYVEELRDESVVIVDIRSNMGGNNLLSAQWLHRLIGEVVPTNSIILQLGNRQQTLDAFASVPADQPHYRPLADFMTYHPTTPLGDAHFVWNYTPRRIIPTDKLIILLTDRYTMSAGEGFVDFALSMENTLVIGQNTAGCFHKIAGTAHFLPHSGIPVHFGAGVVFHQDNLFAEGIGFEPDVWVNGDALQAVLAMLSRNIERVPS